MVAMSRNGGRRALRWYEWAHASFPTVVDCRPLDVPPLLRAAGFQVGEVERRSVSGLPIEVVCGVL